MDSEHKSYPKNTCCLAKTLPTNLFCMHFNQRHPLVPRSDLPRKTYIWLILNKSRLLILGKKLLINALPLVTFLVFVGILVKTKTVSGAINTVRRAVRVPLTVFLAVDQAIGDAITIITATFVTVSIHVFTRVGTRRVGPVTATDAVIVAPLVRSGVVATAAITVLEVIIYIYSMSVRRRFVLEVVAGKVATKTHFSQFAMRFASRLRPKLSSSS